MFHLELANKNFYKVIINNIGAGYKNCKRLILKLKNWGKKSKEVIMELVEYCITKAYFLCVKLFW